MTILQAILILFDKSISGTLICWLFFSFTVIVTNIFQLHLQLQLFLFFSYFKQLQSYGQRPKSEHQSQKYQHSTV